ncbi:MAG: hypothetical protein ABIL66_07375 [candidate division WOR-3 bacterium]
MEFIIFFFLAQVDLNVTFYEKQVPFDVEAKIYEIDSVFAQKLEFFKNYPALQKALLFLQPDSSYVIEIYSKKDGIIIREKVNVQADQIVQIQKEIVSLREKEIPTVILDRTGYGEFLGGSFVFAYCIQAPLSVMAVNPDNSRVGVAVYMLSSSAGFVIPLLLTKNCNVSKAHANMFMYGGYNGLYIAGALASIADMNVLEGTGALFTLAGSVVGEYTGFQSVNRFNLSMGRGNTIMIIGDFTGASSAGLLSLFDNWSDPTFNHRHYLASSIFGIGAGIFLGSEVTRKVNLADGDYLIFGNCGIVGAASLPVLLSYFDDGHGRVSGKMYISAGITGLGLGSILGYKIVENKDFSESEANIIAVGGVAGSLASAGLIFLAGNENPKVYWTGAIAGDIIGTLATASFIKAGKSDKHSKLHLHPESLINAGLCYTNNIPFRNSIITYRF